MTVKEAAERMGVAQNFIRIGLRNKILPFGCAVKVSTRWTYFINREQFERYINE